MSHAVRRAVPAILVVMSLLVVACASGRGEDTSSPDPTSAASPGATASGTFGTLDSPCGPGDASGATDQGVTDDAIQIGYGDDSGYLAAPGLDHQVGDAVAAFIAWCNDQGGINGRQVVGTRYDAKITEVTNVIAEACGKSFFLVGELWVLDDAQEPARRECGLPAVPAAAGTALFANAPQKYEPVSSAIDRASVYAGVKLAEMYPEQVTHAGILWGDYPVMRDRKDQMQEALTSVGWQFEPDCSLSYNVQGEADWKPLVQKLKNCGAEVVYYVGAPYPNLENALTAAKQVDFDPIWLADTNTYDDSFRQWNQDGLADKLYFRMAFLPFDEVDRAEAIQQFLDIVEASGGDANQLGEQAASAFLLWATAAQACGSDLTRRCVEQHLSEVHEWTGGGLHATGDPGANEPPECGLMMNLKGTTFIRVAPEQPGTFECDPSYVYDLSPTSDLLTRHDIGPDRIAPI